VVHSAIERTSHEPGTLVRSRRRLERDAPAPTTDRTSVLAVSDCLVGALLALTLVVIPAFWDDGRVRATISGYEKLGAFSSYYTRPTLHSRLGTGGHG